MPRARQHKANADANEVKICARCLQRFGRSLSDPQASQIKGSRWTGSYWNERAEVKPRELQRSERPGQAKARE